MNKETIDYTISLIKSARNKNHWKIRKLISKIEILVSDYRVTALKMRGTDVARYCNSEATRIENQLNRAKETL